MKILQTARRILSLANVGLAGRVFEDLDTELFVFQHHGLRPKKNLGGIESCTA